MNNAETFPVQIVDGHIVASIGNAQFLIDTGAPSSFYRLNHLSILGKKFSLPSTGMLDLTSSQLTGYIGCTIDGLVGNDIMGQFDVQWTRDSMTFARGASIKPQEHSIIIPIVELIMGIPIIMGKIDGQQQEQRMFFDTGAKLSYLADEFIPEGLDSAGQVQDFYPTLGLFTVDTYDVKISFGVEPEITEQLCTVGTLPQPLQSMLVMGRAKAIIGSELLNTYDTITLSPKNKQFVLYRK